VVLAFAVVAGGAVGVAAFRRSEEVAARRASSKEKAGAVRANATLSLGIIKDTESANSVPASQPRIAESATSPPPA